MKSIIFISTVFIFSLVWMSSSYEKPISGNSNTEESNLSKIPASEPFDKMMQVLTHKRCVNCHPNGDRPRQGEDSHYHNFGVMRGDKNHGVAALQCESCHAHENNDFSGVPGAPEWSLAPIEMAWEGLSRVEIEHALVLWAWEPGVDAEGNEREKPPVPKDEYIKAVKEWAEAGAAIPEK